MISTFWFIGDHGTFDEARFGRMGASDISASIPNPENPVESLAGYGRTALTVCQEKRGEIPREPAGLPAEMGHHNENKTLELVIRYFYDHEEGLRFRLAKERYESDCEFAILNKKPQPSAREYQTGGPFLHSTQYFVDGMIVHPDMIFVGLPEMKGKKERFVKYEGLTIDLSKPWNVEAKNANHYAVKRPEGSMVKGYDLELQSWQGIPLKHYMQIQFQDALFQIETGLLALMSDSADFHVWKIDADQTTQNSIIDIVGRMVRHIKDGTLPRELAMNAADVMVMYPDVKDDYIMLSGEKLKAAQDAKKQVKDARRQIKNWKQIEDDGKNALAVYLTEYEEIRDGKECLAKWSFRKPSESIPKPDKDNKDSLVLQLKKNHKTVYNYLKRKGFVKESKGSRYIKV